jgi:hypothetical protein|tara:strand:+ start:211 stop:999 length:789 start_codon:yes stop_codon:yes gene_type:complete
MKLSIFFIVFISSFNSLANTWTYKQQEDSFNDQTKHIAHITGKNKTSLTVRCNENSSLDIYFFFNNFLSNKSVPVRWRIDKREPQAGKWKVSSKGTSVFSHHDIKNDLARDLTKGSKVLFEATDYRGTKHKINFSLKGSSKAILPVLKACNIPKTKITFNDISEDISAYIDKMGPKSTICLSKELKLNDYKITEISHHKTKELYIEAQRFLDEKRKPCHTVDGRFIGEKCNKPSEFFFDLYFAAKLKDEDIVKECGSLKLEL